MKRSVLAVVLLLAGCGGSSNPPSPTPTPISSSWQCRYCTGGSVALTAAGLPQVTFPSGGSCPGVRAGNDPTQPSFNVSACHHVDYVTRGPMPLNQSITIDYTVAGNPVWGVSTAADNVGNSTPPKLTLIIEHSGDQYLDVLYWRWYAYAGPMTVGRHHVTVPLDWTKWGDVQSPPPGTLAQWNDMMANQGAVGFVLGGGCCAGHGLYLTSGSAVVTVNSFTSP